MAVVESRFRVMASDVHLILVDPVADAFGLAEKRLRRLEAEWSRFLPDSDISRFNTSSDGWLSVAPDTLTLIETMQLAASITDGAYDPTMVNEILRAGYCCSIDDDTRVGVTIDLPCPELTVADVTVDRHTGRVFSPRGLGLDPGGIGKGLAADIVVETLLEAGTGGALVTIGGDLAAGGEAPASSGWCVAIEDAFDKSREQCVVMLGRGGVATSSTRSRRWLQSGVARHHILDPGARGCSETSLAAVTVVAATGWLAEAHSTAAMLAGSDGVVSYLDSRALAGIATTNDRRSLATGALGDALLTPHTHDAVTV